ncbi:MULTISPECIES: hypothetical protein [Rhizobium/Agrobacterium group]|uniref:hypothetical protein n=1 Tax=Rhizobium/Agrobacterium group TaxID=227290 RepID=UPI0015DCCF98|nr:MULTISPECIES: hypothetical protein [Rhizobium/Agrobacterium group]BCH62330.1 hypothetical protein RvVAR0630_pl04720 [Agrobacterium vitis]
MNQVDKEAIASLLRDIAEWHDVSREAVEQLFAGLSQVVAFKGSSIIRSSAAWVSGRRAACL